MKTARLRPSAWLAAVLLILPVAAHADPGAPPDFAGPCQTRPPRPPEMPGLMPPPGMPPHLLDRLALDEAQQDELFALLHAQAPRQRAAMKSATAAREELRKLSTSARYDATQARKLADAHGQAIAELMLLQAETDARLRALLTPEQRARLDHADRPAKPAETRR